jgi:hypothetical protein
MNMFIPSSERDVRRPSIAVACWVLGLALAIPGATETSAPQARPEAGPAQHELPGQPPAPGAQQPQSPSEQPEMNPAPLTPKQQRAILKSNYAKMKQDAEELATLAKSLQEDLNKSNANVLSLKVVEKADKIEKLAKKIKGAALQ